MRVPRSVLRPRLHPVARKAAPVARTSGTFPRRDPRSPRSPFRSALPDDPVLWPLLTSRSAHQRRPFRREARSPQVRTSTFGARPPDLRRSPLVAGASRLCARSPRSASPHIRFLFVGPPLLLRASSRHSLAVMPLRFAFGRCDLLPPGLSPGSRCPCWAHARARRSGSAAASFAALHCAQARERL